MNYQGLNNLIIKNQYLLPFINKWLDQLGQAKIFTQLNLTSTYFQIKIKENNKQMIVFYIKYGYFKY